MSKILKNKITIFYFCMSVLVILVHSINVDNRLINFIVNNICIFAVPSFFFMSGFLFFYNLNNKNDLIIKLKKRFYTVLIPYFAFNSIYYFINLVIKLNFKFDANMFIYAVLNNTFNPPFWYMKQLIYLFIISPIIYFILKKKIYSYIFFVFLSLLIVLYINTIINFINVDALIYFFTGSFFGRYYKNIIFTIKEKKNVVCFLLISIILYLMIILLRQIILLNGFIFCFIQLLYIYYKITFSLFLFFLFDFIFEYNTVKEYMKNNFFLYATHYFVARTIIYIFSFIFKNVNSYNNIMYNIMVFILFCLTPLVSVIFAFYLKKLLCKLSPKYYSFLTGGR